MFCMLFFCCMHRFYPGQGETQVVVFGCNHDLCAYILTITFSLCGEYLSHTTTIRTNSSMWKVNKERQAGRWWQCGSGGRGRSCGGTDGVRGCSKWRRWSRDDMGVENVQQTAHHEHIHTYSMTSNCLWPSKRKIYNTKVMWNGDMNLHLNKIERSTVCDEFDKTRLKKFQI